VFALDIRGHGASGTKGHIGYIGQLESDMQAFVDVVKPVHPSTLIGFSSGGGFVLRVAASDMQSAFDHYLLLSPFLGPDAPNYRPGSGGWVSVGVPRIVALMALNKVGIRCWNHLPVTRFALSEQARKFLTPEYDFNMAMNFSVHKDYQRDIHDAKGKVSVLAGDADEAFYTQELQGGWACILAIPPAPL
jgi:alpha-beta hydrolase superfamily lysophospholipase